MQTHGEVKVRSQQLEELGPKSIVESRIVITHDHAWYALVLDNMLEE